MSATDGTTFTSAVIVAAGSGRRFGADMPKVYAALGDRPLLAWTILAFEQCTAIEEIVLVVNADWLGYALEDCVAPIGARKISRIVEGGAERQHSVANGVRATSSLAELVAVHDGARPLVTPDLIARTVAAAQIHGAAIPGLAIHDTVRRLEGTMLTTTVPRESLRTVQTPQVARRSRLLEAFAELERSGQLVTDEGQALERLGDVCAFVEGERDNLKVTTPRDLLLAESILRERLDASAHPVS